MIEASDSIEPVDPLSGGFDETTTWVSRLRRGAGPLLLGAAIVLPRATGLLTLPVYTRLLGPEDFGRFELLTSFLALAYGVCLLGLDFAISVRFYGRSVEGRRDDLASAFVAAGMTATAVSLPLAVGAFAIGPIALATADGGLSFAITVLAIPFNVLGGLLAMFLRLQTKGTQFLSAMLGGAVIGTAIGVTLVVIADLGLLGAVIGLTTVHIATFVLLAVAARSDLRRSPRRRTMNQLVRIGAPMIPAAIAVWVFALADRLFVSGLVGMVQLGLYAAAARLSMILSFVQFGFHAAWGPAALRWGTSPDRDRSYAASLRFVAVAGGAGVAITSWLAEPLLVILAGEEFREAHGVVWILAGSVLFSAMFYVVQIGSSLAQRGQGVAMTLIVAAVLNTALNIVLIPTWGYAGAAVATLVTFFVAYLLMYRRSQSVTPLRLRIGAPSASACAWIGLSSLATLVPAELRPATTVAVLALAVAVGTGALRQAASRDGIRPLESHDPRAVS